ncbi:hypothetical protein L6452_17437 [Arctium lappa]|uniref:Uncharacterized protein n=1 Tax=Arctium lappa TaxID=4217 RepID=A0ACB9C3D9_ARCLA|nr:hypothetical protein L6452_17437 [Arctium lappa]
MATSISLKHFIEHLVLEEEARSSVANNLWGLRFGSKMFDRCGCGRNHLPAVVRKRFMMFSLLVAAVVLSIDVSAVDVQELLGCCV